MAGAHRLLRLLVAVDAFTRQVNRATAETARGADHVIQDLLGEADLEWARLDDRSLGPAEEAKLLDLYVRSGIYTGRP